MRFGLLTVITFSAAAGESDAAMLTRCANFANALAQQHPEHVITWWVRRIDAGAVELVIYTTYPTRTDAISARSEIEVFIASRASEGGDVGSQSRFEIKASYDLYGAVKGIDIDEGSTHISIEE